MLLNVPYPPLPALNRLRCRCVRCGAHTQATVGIKISGQCGTCDGYDLRVVRAIKASA